MIAETKGHSKLDDVMKHRREVCAEFESQPTATTADATATSRENHSRTRTAHDLVTATGRHATSNRELQELLTERRQRCQVLESLPRPGGADALWNREVDRRSSALCLESTPGDHVADFKWDDPVDLRPQGHQGHQGHQGQWSAHQSGQSQRSSRPTALHAVRSSTSSGSDLSSGASHHGFNGTKGDIHGTSVCGSEVGQVELCWKKLLQRDDGDRGENTEVQAMSVARGLQEVLRTHLGHLEEEQRTRMATAFTEKYLAYLRFEKDHLLLVISMLLRYHHPAVLAELSKGLDCTLDELSRKLGPLQFLLGEMAEAEAGQECLEGLWELCSFSLDHRSEVIVLFQLLAALARPFVRVDPGPESFRSLLQEADEMLKATPRSVLFSLSTRPTGPSGPHVAAVQRGLGCCGCLRVAPDEVLQHVYERPTVDWKLVVVDLRDTGGGEHCLGLPVCIRLGQMLRRPFRVEEILEVLPQDQAIHLCLVDDEPEEDQAILCDQLSRKVRHISVVDGGWKALEEMILALGLELLPSENDKENTPEAKANNAETGLSSGYSKGLSKGLSSGSSTWAFPWGFARHYRSVEACDELLDL